MERIESNYTVMLGKPVIKGTRITVELILRKLGQGATISDVLEMYPNVTAEDIYACLIYSADNIANEESLSTTK
jgi:uncharacterized protein (DUF433 family)